MTIIETALDLVPDDSLIDHASPGAARTDCHANVHLGGASR
jgi:hypothetical protein